MIYQLRSMKGNKLFERNNPDEVRHFIRNRIDLKDCQVWILEDYPGSLKDVVNASEFMNQQKQHEMFK